MIDKKTNNTNWRLKVIIASLVVVVAALTFLLIQKPDSANATDTENSQSKYEEEMRKKEIERQLAFEQAEKNLAQHIESENARVQEEIRKNEEENRDNEEENRDNEWIYGTWEYRNPYGSTTVIISKNNLCQYVGENLTYNGSYDIQDGKIKYDGTCAIPIDYVNHRLMADNNIALTKANSNSDSNNSGNYSEQETRMAARLHDLGEEGKSLLSEIDMMRRSGQADPMRLVFIRQRLEVIKDEQIRIAERLGWNDLAAELRQQKRQVLSALKAMGL